MRKISLIAFSICLCSLAILFEGCSDDGDGGVVIPDFDVPVTVDFEQNLSTYNIFKDNPQNLIPSDSFHLVELSSILFTDYAHKQRLVKMPKNELPVMNQDESLTFPDETILVKTFFYYFDERNIDLGKRIIETRLLIKRNGFWNVATYIWNEDQTDATLELNGVDITVDWIDAFGVNRSTLYDVPDENECIACHQSDSDIIPLGTTLRNLNRTVDRNDLNLNQLQHLQNVNILPDFDISQIAEIVDYMDTDLSLSTRARAYLHMNCSHCHNPSGWEEPAEQDLDFRYETPFGATGIQDEADQIIELIEDGEMPFIGTTILDDDGVELIVDYINSL